MLDPIIRSAVDLEYIQIGPRRNAHAVMAHPAWLRRRRLACHTVQRFGQYPRGRRLAYAPGADKQEGMPYPP